MADTTRSAPASNSSGLNSRERRPKSPIPGNYGGRTCIPLEDLDAFLADLEDEEESDSSLPRESQWYHGRLDRYTSEQRLLQAGKHGSYLVRESDRKPGSYVLSFLGKTGINHFRITAVCGDFYIGGRQFDCLPDLISYYTNSSDLLKRERLLFPVPPPVPVNDKKKVVAILPYSKMPDTDELTFEKGEIFFVHNDMGDGWLWVTAHRTGEQGMIFRELVEDLDQNIDPNTVFSWFHPVIPKNEAVDMLVKAGPGSFLVRPSDNSPGDYSLFYHINNQIQRFRIEKRGVRYLMGGRTFDCLDAVIERYRREQIVEGHTLMLPVCRKVAETDGQVTMVAPKEVQHADKIYETLRECREQSGLKKNKGIKLQGYLQKRSDKSKRWKMLHFVLVNEGTDSHLYFYENPKVHFFSPDDDSTREGRRNVDQYVLFNDTETYDRLLISPFFWQRTKPKGLIDLNCSYLYHVHDSLFDRPNCFQLVERALPCLSTITYLSSNSEDSLQEWISTLKPLCVTQCAKPPKVDRLREIRCLQLQVLTAHRLPHKLVPNPFCVISLNEVRVAKTKVICGPDPAWDEEFILDDIPPDILSFTVSVHNKGKRSKNNEVSEVTKELSSLKNGEEKEDWYSLSGITPIGEWGVIKLKTKYVHDLIMPQEEYSPLHELVLDPSLEVVRALADICHSDRLPLASSLLKIFRAKHKEADLMVALNDWEIEKEEETSTLFRGASLTTTIMDLYMKSICDGFLQASVQEIVLKLLEARQSCELNPAKMNSPDDACANAEFLLQVLDDVTHTIFISEDACPKTLRYICGCLQRSVVNKWPNERLVKTRVVSGFIFLRLLCPALLNPRQFNLIPEPPPQMAARSLIMVAKCLQNLANLIEFGGKEPYMEVVNPFILKNKERMVVYLDRLSNCTEKPPSEDKAVKIDLARDLGTLHNICVTHLKELQELGKTNTTIKKLVTVTEMHTKHKQKYLEMIK